MRPLMNTDQPSWFASSTSARAVFGESTAAARIASPAALPRRFLILPVTVSPYSEPEAPRIGLPSALHAERHRVKRYVTRSPSRFNALPRLPRLRVRE